MIAALCEQDQSRHTFMTLRDQLLRLHVARELGSTNLHLDAGPSDNLIFSDEIQENICKHELHWDYH